MKYALMVASLAASAWGQGVTFDRILNADKEPQNWLTYSGNVMGQRYSPLTQITPANVKNLELQWVWQARSLERFETTALVVDGVMYTVQAPNDVVALDAGHRAALLDDSYTTVAGSPSVLRTRESRTRDSRRHVVHGHASTRT